MTHRTKQEDRNYLEFVDATSGDFYKPELAGLKVAVCSAVDATGAPAHRAKDVGLFDPRCLRFHDLQRPGPAGADERYLSIQTVNTFDADYQPTRDGDSPYAQPDFFTALNRSTREADTSGRSAIPGSHRRIIDSEDGLYALSLTLNEVNLPEPGTSAGGDDEAAEPITVPEGVAFREAGTESGSGGTVTRYQPSVSFGGFTVFGEAAVEAAKRVLKEGGTLEQARTAAKKAAGMPVSQAEQEAADATNTSQTREPPAAPPDDDGEGEVVASPVPGGYVSARSGKTGMLGTYFTPETGAGLFVGREGHEIGILPVRHDAQVALSKELIGRWHILRDDATAIPEQKTGKLIKGMFLPDKSVANQDSALGHETMQLRPCVRISAEDIPPGRPPLPPFPPQPPKPENDTGKPPEGSGGPRGPEEGGPKRGPRENDPQAPELGGSSGEALTTPPQPPVRRPETGGGSGSGDGSSGGTPTPTGGGGPETGGGLPPVTNPQSQVRDLGAQGTPCPNATSGAAVTGSGGANTTGGQTTTGGSSTGGTIPSGGGLTTTSGAGATGASGGYTLGGGVSYGPGKSGALTTRGFPAVTTTPGGQLAVGGQAAGAAAASDPKLDARVNLERGLNPLGNPFLDYNGDPISPVDFNPLNDPRVPLEALPKIEDLPRNQQAIARAQRAARAKRQERQRKADQTRDQRLEERQAQRERETKERFDQREQELQDRIEKAPQGEAGRAERERLKRELDRNQKQREKQQERDAKQRERNERTKRNRERDEARAKARREREEARRARRTKRARESNATSSGAGMVIDVNTGHGIGVIPGRGTVDDPDELRDFFEGDPAEERSKFGDWNTANSPTPIWGTIGGPATVGDALALYSLQLAATREVVNAAFAGPGYLESNVALVHKNTSGNPPAGSTIGNEVTAELGEVIVTGGRTGVAPLSVPSTLVAKSGGSIYATGGGLIDVVRSVRGGGSITDLRPGVLVTTTVADGQPEPKADAFAYGQDRKFAVDYAGGVNGRSGSFVSAPGQTGNAFRVGASAEPGRVGASVDDYFTISTKGLVTATKGALHLPEVAAALELADGYPTIQNIAGTPTFVAADGTETQLGGSGSDVTTPSALPGTGLVEFWTNSSFVSTKYTRQGQAVTVAARLVCSGDPGASGAFYCQFHADTSWEINDEAMGVDWTNADGNAVPVGQGMAIDADTNTFYPITVIYKSDGGSANNGSFFAVNGSPMASVDSSTNPFNWTTNDVLILNFTVTLL